MKTILTFVLMLLCGAGFAQTPFEKTIPFTSGQKIEFNLDDPTIKIQTWDKKEILIKGTVSINSGENDSAFDMTAESSNGITTITSFIKDKENIPQRITISKNDKEYFFKATSFNDPEVKKFLEQNGKDYSYMTMGIIKDIKLEIFVPKNSDTRIIAKFGLVEVVNFNAPLAIDSKFGGVDATIVPAATGEITARSRHGEILTNLGIKFNQVNPMETKNKWTEISAKTGNGPSYNFESKFGNIYLRKPN